MSLESWKKEFYPITANRTNKKDAIEHSLLKWKGLTGKNLAKHNVKIKVGAVADDENMLYVDGDSCSLCYHYYNDTSSWVEGSRCEDCPLYKTLGMDCEGEEQDNYEGGPYSVWRYTKNPSAMIEALERTLDENS